MSVEVSIVEGPLPPAEPRGFEGAGALLQFDGVVRRMEDGRALNALRYTAYEPMASTELEKLARRVVEEHGLLAIEVVHSRGVVGVGEVSFRLRIASRHRKEGLAAADAFIDAMKREVPIWKEPVWQEAKVDR